MRHQQTADASQSAIDITRAVVFAHADDTTEEQTPPPAPDSSARPVKEIKEITRLIRKLERHNPIRKVAAAVLAGETGEQPLYPLWHALSSPDAASWREQKLAAWALGGMRASEHRAVAVNSLLNTLCDWPKMDYWGLTRRSLGRAILTHTLVMPLMAWNMYVHSSPKSPFTAEDFFEMYFALFMLLLPTITIASMLFESERLDHLRAVAATALGRLRAPESLEALLTALKEDSFALNKAAENSLHSVLPALTSDYYGVFRAKTMRQLCGLLSHRDKRLAMKALNALGEIGSGSALPSVERVAKRGRTPQMRERAGEIVPILQARQLRERQSGTLLRAAEVAPSNQLLRSVAENVPDFAPEQLLHPTSPPNA